MLPPIVTTKECQGRIQDLKLGWRKWIGKFENGGGGGGGGGVLYRVKTIHLHCSSMVPCYKVKYIGNKEHIYAHS